MSDAEEEDEIELDRFLEAQDAKPRGARLSAWDQAMAELSAGRKTGHWIWFVFPQCDGVPEWHGATPSERALWFGIAGLEEAAAYLEHPVLGPRLLRGVALARAAGAPAAVFGALDAEKLRSCLTLFARVPGAPAELAAALAELFPDGPCAATVALTGGATRG